MSRKIFASNLKFIRTQRLGLSQNQIAKKIKLPGGGEVNRATYAAWEEQRALPRLEIMPHVLDALGVKDLGKLLNEYLNPVEQQEKATS